MTNQTESGAHAALAQRKAQLLAEGARYRAQISAAQGTVKADLTMDALAQSAFSHIATAAFAAFKQRTSLTGAGWQALIPLLVGGVSALSKKSMLKPVVRGALVLGAFAAAVTFAVRKKKAAKAASAATGSAGEQDVS